VAIGQKMNFVGDIQAKPEPSAKSYRVKSEQHQICLQPSLSPTKRPNRKYPDWVFFL